MSILKEILLVEISFLAIDILWYSLIKIAEFYKLNITLINLFMF